MPNETYTCAICGKHYHDIEQRIACETKCLKQRKEDEAQKKLAEERQQAEKKKQEKKASEQAIEAKFDEVNKMLKEHFSKYDTFYLTHDYPYLNHMFRKGTLWF